MLKEILLIFIGGGSGSLVRYYLSYFVNKTFVATIPFGTLASNVIASFIVSLLFGSVFFTSKRDLWLLLAIGFCGGFSTFSTFSNETLVLFREGQYFYAILNIFLSVLLCLLASLLGFSISKAFNN